MKFTYKRSTFFSLFLLVTQISYGQVDVPQPAQNGPLGGGSWLRFTSGSTNTSTTSIQEAWGLNLIGDLNHPVKVNNASLLIGYTSTGENLGTNQLLVNGRVGIGTTNPIQILDVTGAGASFTGSANANSIFVQDHTNYRGVYLGYDSSDQIGIVAASTNSAPSQLAFWNYGASGWKESMRITSSGNVGIGTTSPGAKLDVNGAIANNRNWFYLAGAGDTNHAIGNIAGDGEQFRFFNFFDLHQASTGVSRLYINSSGNIGIGSTDPVGKLDISESGDASGRTVIGDKNFYNPVISQYKWSGYGSVFFQTSISNSLSAPGSIDFQTGNGGAVIGSDAQTTRMTIFQNGTVAIGTTTMPSGYTFAVNGNAIAESVTVKLHANWPDYVFHPTYHLPTLAEVKTYIDQNHHLPDMPSEKEVADKGVDLGEMNKLLVKKVEELTLYLIQQQKEIEKLKKHIQQK